MPNPQDDLERTSLLDAFAKQEITPPVSVPAGSGSTPMPMPRAGAIKVDIKRDERAVLQRLKALAAHAGEDWFYRYPVKDKKTNRTSYIEGPSIKLANEVARVYGNDEIDTRIIDLGPDWLIYARFTDYETGFSMTRPYQQRKSQRSIGEDADRQRDIALQIGCSKAIRNVVTNALQTFADFAFDEARMSLIDKIGKDIGRWRTNTVGKLEEKVDIKRVEAVMGRAAADWLAPDIAQVIAMMKTVSDGMATIDETFPPLGNPPEEQKTESKIEQFAKAAE